MEIILSKVSKIINHTIVLENISYQFTGGNIYGVIGRNGSGKTMLLRMVSGLILPTTGKVFVNGQELHKQISFPPNLGMIIEKPEFLGYMTGLENLKQIAEIKKIVSEEKIKEYMRIFALDPDSKLSMKKYSLGMKQKIGIIQALMENPDILILDEPFNALDEQSVLKLREILLKKRDEGKLIIITSHNKEDINMVCNKIIQMENGKILNL